MKKLLVVLALIIPVAFAAPVVCDPTASDTQGIAKAVWTAPGFTCQQGDKLFSNFLPGASPADTSLRIMTIVLPTDTFYSVMFGGDFRSGFTIQYDIVITSSDPGMSFRRVSADLLGLPQAAQPMLQKVVYSMDPATHVVDMLLGGITSYVGTPPPAGCTSPFYPCDPLLISGTVRGLHIEDTFTPNGGAAQQIGNAFTQSPEPSAMALLGAGLVALSLLRRRA